MNLQHGKNRIIQIVAVGTVVLLSAVLLWVFLQYRFPGLMPLVRKGDEQAIAAYIHEEGAWIGALLIVLLCILQVMSIVLPGAPIHVAAGILYGWWRGVLMCYTGFVLGNALVFFLARRLKKRFSAYFPVPDRKSWLIRQINSRDPVVVAGLACMAPGVPNGIIPYVAEQAHITGRNYTKAVAATAWLQILTHCLCGHFLIREKYLTAVLIYGTQIAVIAVIAWKRDVILGRLS